MIATQQEAPILHQELLTRLAVARNHTDALFEVIRPGSLYERPIAERHRIVFYIGHLEAFDWNLFYGRIATPRPFDPKFDQLFAFGIDPVGGGLPTDQPADWPSLAEIRSYNSAHAKLLMRPLRAHSPRVTVGSFRPQSFCMSPSNTG